MSYESLRSMSKEEIIKFLIPLIEKATKIDEYWSACDENGFEDPELMKSVEYDDTDAMNASADIWSSLCNLHDDF